MLITFDSVATEAVVIFVVVVLCTYLWIKSVEKIANSIGGMEIIATGEMREKTHSDTLP